MPIYEYRCEACGHELDALQKVSDAPLRKCPACAKQKLRRLISAPSFRLKGGGWYETDFKSDKDRRRNLVEAGGEGGKPATGDGAGDGGKAETTAKDKPASAEKALPAGEGAKSKGDRKPASAKKSGSEAA